MKLTQPSIFIIILGLLLQTSAFAKSKTFKADKAFENHKYTVAAELYNRALKRTKDKEERNLINFRMAECYRFTNNYRRSMNQYKRLIRYNYQEKEPLILLYYADALKAMEEYPEALVQYKAYQALMPEDKRAENGILICESIQSWIENPTKHQITNLEKINSRASDFSPAYGGRTYNTIIFTSTRKEATGKVKDEWTDQEFSDLFISRADRQGNWSKPTLLDNEDASIESDNTINTAANEGTPFMNKNFTQMYFTRCPNTVKKESGCQVYTSKRVNRSWSRPQLLMLGRDTALAVGHPTLSSDEKIIFFSAERPGGKGGKDLWMATRTSRTSAFGSPQNLGKLINTPGDEMFPFLRNDTLLYFSSNGHISMGGLDLFVSRMDGDGNWSQPQNLKSPMNSSHDDFGIVFHDKKEEGYFSSNRKGAKDDDIYFFQIPAVEFTLKGEVKNRETNRPLNEVRVSLHGNDGSMASVRTDENGEYRFEPNQLAKNIEYDITLSIDNYFNATDEFNTLGYEVSHDFTKDFMLQPIPKEPIVLPDILYDFGKWELKPQYRDSLQGLIKTLEENPKLVIELASHTDSRDTEERNQVLSQRRAASVVEYLILRGVHPKRLVPKGYGESQPREIKNRFNRGGLNLKSGTILDEEFISKLDKEAYQEVAHQLNRRTEFKVLRSDFDPHAEFLEKGNSDSPRSKPKRRVLPFIKEDGEIKANCTLNGHDFTFVYQEDTEAEIPLREALKLLNSGVITKDDFINDEDLQHGSIRNGAEFYIKELIIAGKPVRNLTIKVNNRLKGKLIIGESTLIMFGLFNFDDEKKVVIFR